MRCFIAIDMPEAVEQECKRVQDSFDMKGLKRTKSFHLTLKFLGEIDEKQLDQLKAKLEQIKISKFSLEITELGVFPDKKRPRVLWIGLKGDVGDIQKEVDEKLSGMFDKDNRFHPHITLARINFLKDKASFIQKMGVKVEKLGFEVDKFILYKSTLTPQGPIYEKIKEFYLSSKDTS